MLRLGNDPCPKRRSFPLIGILKETHCVWNGAENCCCILRSSENICNFTSLFSYLLCVLPLGHCLSWSDMNNYKEIQLKTESLYIIYAPLRIATLLLRAVTNITGRLLPEVQGFHLNIDGLFNRGDSSRISEAWRILASYVFPVTSFIIIILANFSFKFIYLIYKVNPQPRMCVLLAVQHPGYLGQPPWKRVGGGSSEGWNKLHPWASGRTWEREFQPSRVLESPLWERGRDRDWFS